MSERVYNRDKSSALNSRPLDAPVRQRRQFVALTEARVVRDRLAVTALSDARTAMSEAKAVKLIETICEAKGDFRREISALQVDCYENWDGEGMPSWGYLDELGDAVEYIAEQERKLANTQRSQRAAPGGTLGSRAC